MRHVTPLTPLMFALVACDTARDTPTEVHHTASIAHAIGSSDDGLAAAPIDVSVALAPVVPPTPDVARVSLDELCAPIASATCRVHLGCRSGVSREALDACQQHIIAACEAERPRLEARVTAGTLRFDRAALRDCEARIDLLACAPPAEMQTALGDGCDAVLVGALGRGAACSNAGDCGPGLACTTAAGECPGRCEPLGALGEACDGETIPCGAALSCEDGRCVPAHVTLGAACATSAQCPDGTYCDDVEAGATCVPRRVVGAACDDDEQCAAADFCRLLTLGDDVELEVGSCQPRVDAGAACDPLIGGCAVGLACDEVLGVCSRAPDSAGQTCVADVAPCGEGTGLVCDADVCELEPFVGDACDPTRDVGGDGAECRFGFCAADAEATGVGACQAFRAADASCDDDRQCGALACVQGRCDRPLTRCIATLHDINLGFRYRIR